MKSKPSQICPPIEVKVQSKATMGQLHLFAEAAVKLKPQGHVVDSGLRHGTLVTETCARIYNEIKADELRTNKPQWALETVKAFIAVEEKIK